MHPSVDDTALLVVDMQNGFCHDDGAINRMGLPAARLRGAIEPCARLVAAARGARVPVLFTRYVYRPDYADGGLLVNELMPDLKTKRFGPAVGTPRSSTRWHPQPASPSSTRTAPAPFSAPTWTRPSKRWARAIWWCAG